MIIVLVPTISIENQEVTGEENSSISSYCFSPSYIYTLNIMSETMSFWNSKISQITIEKISLKVTKYRNKT